MTRNQAYGGKQGFTLVEIMIVVAIIGVLATLAVPAFLKARNRAQVTAVANDLRVFAEAFHMYALEYGTYPGEMEGPAFMPPDQGINQYFDLDDFTNAAALDSGGYDWDGPGAHAWYGISIRPNQMKLEKIQALDEMMDDGDLNTGSMRWMYGGGRYAYILEMI